MGANMAAREEGWKPSSHRLRRLLGQLALDLIFVPQHEAVGDQHILEHGDGSADGSVPILLWFVLIVGGIITPSYPAFFGATNRLAQTLMTATLAALVALALLLALAMDYPFAGDEKISVQPFDEALDQMPPSLPTH
jgi:hypothetical protein